MDWLKILMIGNTHHFTKNRRSDCPLSDKDKHKVNTQY